MSSVVLILPATPSASRGLVIAWQLGRQDFDVEYLREANINLAVSPWDVQEAYHNSPTYSSTMWWGSA